MKLKFARNDRGVIMVAILVLVLVAMVIGFAMMMASRTSIKLSADYRGKTSLYYRAEDGINKTLAQFVNNPDLGESAANGGFDKYTGQVTCDKNKSPTLPPGSNGDIDGIRCNFLGDAENAGSKYNLQVVVSRYADHCRNGTLLASDPNDIKTSCEDDTSDTTDGQVYLVNSIATDNTGRQEVVQAIIVIPMMRTLVVENGATVAKTVRHPYLSPYLASLVKGRKHIAPDPTAAPTPSPTPTSTPTSTPGPTKTPVPTKEIFPSTG